MNACIRQSICLLLAAGVAACDVKRAEHASSDTEGARQIQLFDKNRGVRLPEEMQRDLGVVSVEVVERSVTPRIERIARVYRAADGGTPAAASVWLSEVESNGLRVGQKVAMIFSASPIVTVKGTLMRLETNVLGAGAVEVLIQFADTARRSPVGSVVTAIFSAERPHTALTVPDSAIIHGATGAFVYAVNGGHFTRTAVKLGVKDDGWAEVTDGLFAGDIVAGKAADSLWLIELCALKGGTPCCPVPGKKASK